MKKRTVAILATSVFLLVGCNSTDVGVIGGSDGPTSVFIGERNDVIEEIDTWATFKLTIEGDVYAKGLNECGELGLGHINEVTEMTKIDGLKDINKMVFGQDESRISAYFINKNGDVYVSGCNRDGQLGLGHTSNVLVPTKVEGLKNIKDIETSRYLEFNTYFIDINGNVYVSGGNTNGELGLGHSQRVTVPTKVKELSKIKKVVYGDRFGYTKYLGEDGTIYVSGCANYFDSAEEIGNKYLIENVKKVNGLENIEIIEIDESNMIEHKCIAENGDFYIIKNDQVGVSAEKISLKKVLAPTGFAGSSLNRIVLYSSGDVYWVQYDGEGFETENIVKDVLVASNASDIEMFEGEGVLVKGDNLKVVEDMELGWLKFNE